jgi:tyrosyl-tRNA synthetase
MFGKIMSLRDELIIKYFTLCTDLSEEEILEYEKQIKNGANPRDIKFILAEEIVKMYHSEKLAAQAKQNFIEVFQNKGLPDDIPEVFVEEGEMFSDAALKAGVIDSKSEWKRLVEEGAVTFEDGTTLEDYKEKAKTATIKIGKKRFLKIKA